MSRAQPTSAITWVPTMSSTQEKYPQDLLSSYSTSGFAPSSDGLPFGNKPIFTVIDVCEAYLTPGSILYAPERFHSALQWDFNPRVSREKDTSHLHPHGVSVSRVWKQLVQVQDSKRSSCFDTSNKIGDKPAESKICIPKPGEIVIEKQFINLFFGTFLASVHIGMKVDTIAICGYSTSSCVRATTKDTMQYGFGPFVVGDTCGDRYIRMRPIILTSRPSLARSCRRRRSCSRWLERARLLNDRYMPWPHPQ